MGRSALSNLRNMKPAAIDDHKSIQLNIDLVEESFLYLESVASVDAVSVNEVDVMVSRFGGNIKWEWDNHIYPRIPEDEKLRCFKHFYNYLQRIEANNIR